MDGEGTYGSPIFVRGNEMSGNWHAVRAFFEMSCHDAEEIFQNDGRSEFSDSSLLPAPKNDKMKILARIRNYLAEKGVITAERNEELRIQENTNTIEFVS